MRVKYKTKYEGDRCSACCYSPAVPFNMKEECVCDGCGGTCYFHVRTYRRDSMVLRYQDLAKDFTSSRYDASVKFYCRDCVKKETGLLAPIVFSFRINDIEEPVLSYPDYTGYDDLDYRLVLDFLNGITSLPDFAGKYRYYHELDGADGRVYTNKIRSIIGPLKKPNKPPEDTRRDESEYVHKDKGEFMPGRRR